MLSRRGIHAESFHHLFEWSTWLVAVLLLGAAQFEKVLGILETLKPKTTRYPDGASVMEHVIRGSGNEIGFGAITEIRLYEPKGLAYVGPLPDDVQNYTTYEIALMRGAQQPGAARAALKLLGTPAGRSAFVDGGVQ